MRFASDSTISPWETAFANREERALAAAHAVDDAVLDGSSETIILDAIVNDHAAPHVQPLYDRFRIDPEEPPAIAGQPPSTSAAELSLKFVLPIEGPADALTRAGLSSHGGKSSGYNNYEVYISLTFPDLDSSLQNEVEDAIAQARADWFAQAATATLSANREIDKHRTRIRRDAGAVLSTRYRRRAILVGAAKKLDIPLTALDMPAPLTLRPQALNLSEVEKAAAAGGAEAGLAEDIANSLIELISSFGIALERSPETANRLLREDEESIRDVLLFIMNANWKGAATGETFLGKGKTDILLRWHNRDAFIGECKFWKGEQYFSDGVDQLLDRYTVWRATRVAMILFIRDIKDLTAVRRKAEAALEDHPRHVGRAGEIAGQASYLMKAQHDHQQLVTLTLIPVILPNTSVR